MVQDEQAARSDAGKTSDIRELAHELLDCGVPVEMTKHGTIEVRLVGREHIEIAPTANGGGWRMEAHIVIASELSANEIKSNVISCNEISAAARTVLAGIFPDTH